MSPSPQHGHLVAVERLEGGLVDLQTCLPDVCLTARSMLSGPCFVDGRDTKRPSGSICIIFGGISMASCSSLCFSLGPDSSPFVVHIHLPTPSKRQPQETTDFGSWRTIIVCMIALDAVTAEFVFRIYSLILRIGPQGKLLLRG